MHVQYFEEAIDACSFVNDFSVEIIGITYDSAVRQFVLFFKYV